MRSWWIPGLVPVFLLAASGCGEARSARSEGPAEEPAPAGVAFDPAEAGTVRGRVTWPGELPAVAPFDIPAIPQADGSVQPPMQRANPNAPAVDPATRGVGQAIVFLRGVDPRRGRPWDHPPVRVEFRDDRLSVVQGQRESRTGFVRRTDAIEVVSRQPVFDALHADGAAFFTLPFPDADQPSRRSLVKPGVVELTSGARRWWLRSYLFVDDHPYYTWTGTQGEFALHQVPPGTYEVVCWVPNWTEARRERDTESSQIVRWFFRPPVEQSLSITLKRGTTEEVGFELSRADFGR